MEFDKIIIGAGLYGLYSAIHCAGLGQKVLVLEHDPEPFMRATYANQARVHMGYHYPRSYSTAVKSAHYFQRFMEDYGYCVHSKFRQVYATSSRHSWTNADQFRKFCRAANIRCDEVSPERFFQNGLCDGAFLTEEYTYDAQVLKKCLLAQLGEMGNVQLVCNAKIQEIAKGGTDYQVALQGGGSYRAPFVLNAAYASVNQVLKKMGYEAFKIKYELCEIILCNVGDSLAGTGITVMDGPFFSIMPFGKTGGHSLTSVAFTPHSTSYEELPTFSCQEGNGGFCSPGQLGNCNGCSHKPKSAWGYMSSLARKYLKEEYGFSYRESLFSMKPILKASEIDDSRPTVIKYFSRDPTFVSVLSGKINTVYDLEEVLA